MSRHAALLPCEQARANVEVDYGVHRAKQTVAAVAEAVLRLRAAVPEGSYPSCGSAGCAGRLSSQNPPPIGSCTLRRFSAPI
ncbi:MAG: hypothetical protein L0Z62_39360 [Gemmataceae bacterium]|nr:hypothetical protein [Gemmataceae bacterium]